MGLAMWHRTLTLLSRSQVVSPEAPIATLDTPTAQSHHAADMLSTFHYIICISGLTGRSPGTLVAAGDVAPRPIVPLYTAEERRRRDASPWTRAQAVLAPIQFVIFLVSLGLVLRYLASGDGLALATESVVVKTIALYAIMITGSVWEREVFGQYLFARPFFWEDVFSILVLALHTMYLVALATDALTPRALMLLALAAYAAYVVNATQFLLKLRAARRQPPITAVRSLGLAS